MSGREEARTAFERRDWAACYAAYGECDDLDGDDQDALAAVAMWLGRTDEAIAAHTQAYRLHLEADAAPRAAYSAFMLAIHLRLVGEAAQSAGWLARAHRLLADAPESRAHGYPLYLRIAGLLGSDLDEALTEARRMQGIGRDFDDDALVALGMFFEGRALVRQTKVQEGLALLDEAMLAALSDRLDPMWTGAIYCGLLDACHELADHSRAAEWTEATRRWCAPLPTASLYPGICRIHWAEVLAARGSWDEAEQEALAACQELERIDVFAVADGHYEVGEIRRFRGDLTGAEDAYERAHELGRDPQPGLALLRLAQGRPDQAAASIAAALQVAAPAPLERARFLSAQVPIALAAGHLDTATAAATELDATARTFGSLGLRAEAHRCRGAVELATGSTVVALASLRQACGLWQELDVPFELARTRLLVADAYAALGDGDAAERERAAARACFERLGALGELQALAPTAAAAPAGLTPREVEVLAMVATGRTNRQIAEDLVLSEKTVARHVANIFTKLGVSSRAAATAFAFSNGVVDPV
jgi:ATP/maltotriose-dependent transcriptional regulator MalT